MTDYWYVSETWGTKQLMPDLQAVRRMAYC